MPRWLRQFTFNKINEFYQKESDEFNRVKNNSSTKSTLVDSAGNVNKEAFREASPKIAPGPKVKYK